MRDQGWGKYAMVFGANVKGIVGATTVVVVVDIVVAEPLGKHPLLDALVVHS